LLYITVGFCLGDEVIKLAVVVSTAIFDGVLGTVSDVSSFNGSEA